MNGLSKECDAGLKPLCIKIVINMSQISLSESRAKRLIFNTFNMPYKVLAIDLSSRKYLVGMNKLSADELYVTKVDQGVKQRKRKGLVRVRRSKERKVPGSKQYNPYLDVLKGFAILLVVLGHSVQMNVADGNFDGNLLFRIIYSFHMPLFMFLSGAAAAYSIRPMNMEFIKRKFYQLIIPFVAWYLIGYFLGGAHYRGVHFMTYIHDVIVSPDDGLWFLYVLFVNFCCLAFIRKLEPKLKLWSYLITWLVIYALPTAKYGVGLVKWHLPFFITGYLIFRYRERLERYSKVPAALSLATFPILAATWHRLYNPAPLTHLDGRLIAHHISNISVGDIATLNVYPVIVLFYLYAVAFSGIGFTYWVFKALHNKYIYSFFGFLGLYTLDVYVVHEYFFRFAIGHSWLEIISGSIGALLLSLLLGIFVLRQVPLLSIVFLGGRAKPYALQWRKKLKTN